MELTPNYAQELAQTAKSARLLITKAASGQSIADYDHGLIFGVLAGLEDIQSFFEEKVY